MKWCIIFARYLGLQHKSSTLPLPLVKYRVYTTQIFIYFSYQASCRKAPVYCLQLSSKVLGRLFFSFFPLPPLAANPVLSKTLCLDA